MTLPTPHSLTGKYFIFRLGAGDFGIEVRNVVEIVRMMKATLVPGSPHFINGVINLRGRVIPVMELRARLNMEQREHTGRTCIAITQIIWDGKPVTMGLVIDEIRDVLDLSADAIQPPDAGRADPEQHVLGTGRIGDRVITILNVEHLLLNDALRAGTGPSFA